MTEIQLGLGEARFADIIWQNAPVTSSQLVRLGAEQLGWKRTTVHTVLGRLCEKGLFCNEKGTVTVCITREQFYSMQSRRVVNEQFDGSLPAFVAAFGKNKKLSKAELDELQQLIDNMRQEV